jgi:thiosulfate reductase/polysulfide reductase chain A
MGFSRRSFLAQASAAFGAAAAASILPWPFRRLSTAEAAEITNYAKGKWVPSCCNMCGGQCGVLAYVEKGLVRKIEPHPTNPNNIANVSASYDAAVKAGDIGRLCCKGNSAIRSLYDPERLRTPLKRVGPRGSGQFQAISWDEAIAEAAAGLHAVKQKYGARSIVWFGEDHSFTHIQQDFCDAIGTPNYSNHSNLCDTSRKAHYLATMGNDRPLADMENCDLLFVWGWNFLSAIKWIHLPAIFTRARMKNPSFRFIYVDPVFNTTASKANVWVAPRPGTDGALALAICKRLVDAGNYDATFVGKYTLGFDEFVKYLNGDGTYDNVPKTSAWAESITGVPAANIDAIALELGNAYIKGAKICIDTWSGPGHHTNATQGGRAINAINLLLGAIDRPGTLGMPLRNGPGRRAKIATWPAKDGWRPDGRDDVVIPATNPDGTANPVNGAIGKKYAISHSSGIYCEMRDRMIEQKDFVGNPFPMKAAVFVFQNFMMSTPNSQKNLEAIHKMDFVLSVDTHLSETALLADIIIPGAQYLERNDLNAGWLMFRSVALRQAVAPSWIGGMTEWQFFLELGGALGLDGFKTDPGLNDTDENMQKDEWATFMATGNGGGPWNNQMTFAQMQAGGVWIETGPTGGTQYEKHLVKKSFVNKGVPASDDKIATITAGAQSVYVVTSADGKTKKGIANGPTMADGEQYVVGFATDSRRAQFWLPSFANYFTGKILPAGKSVANDNRYHPLPFYLPPEEAPTKQFPLHFISWKEVEHTHSRTFNNPWLMEMKGENKLLVHPTAAAAKGLAEDDFAFVQTAYGQVRVRVHITSRIQAETVGFVRGFGHWASGSIAKGRGVHDGWLLSGRAEIHSGQAVHKEVACRIFKDA